MNRGIPHLHLVFWRFFVRIYGSCALFLSLVAIAARESLLLRLRRPAIRRSQNIPLLPLHPSRLLMSVSFVSHPLLSAALVRDTVKKKDK